MTPRQHIAQIDKRIDEVRRELRRLERVDTLSAESWQQAWDRHPDLHRREKELFAQRGINQEQLVATAASMAAKFGRPSRFRKCPTCKARTLAA